MMPQPTVERVEFVAALFTSRLDPVLYWLERFLIENKFIGLFSLLFGVSFWLFLSRAEARGARGTAMFYRRIFWLFVIGLAHGWLLWCFDVLRFYALWAVLLPLFVRMPTRWLLATAVAASILVPAVVAGLNVPAASSARLALDIDATTLAAFSAGTYRDVLRATWRYDWYLTLSIGLIAYQVAVFGRLLLGLFALLFGGFAVQILAANAWVTRFRFGPAEWLWRGLTYGKVPPFRTD